MVTGVDHSDSLTTIKQQNAKTINKQRAAKAPSGKTNSRMSSHVESAMACTKKYKEAITAPMYQICKRDEEKESVSSSSWSVYILQNQAEKINDERRGKKKR